MNLGNNQYKPISFWSWNGDMNETEVRSQVRDFKEKGFGGFFIHSRAGRLISYMGDEWIHHRADGTVLWADGFREHHKNGKCTGQ